MALITDYASLQSNVIGWLNRVGDADLSADVPTLIQAAEAELRRDGRIRDLVLDAAFVVDGDDLTMPADIDYVESWYHDGGVWFGEIDRVSLERLSVIKSQLGSSGAPRYVAIVPSATAGTYTARFAPVPDGSYTTVIAYRPSLPTLSGAAPTNWLLLAHPDIYLYAALVESAPYLKDDERVATWRSELERRLESLHQYVERRQYASGTLRRRPRRVIGA